MKDMIDVTGIDLIRLVKKVYAMSQPVGMGYLHYKEGELSDADADVIIRQGINPDGSSKRIVINMDYVRGRCCKMVVFYENEKLWMRKGWFDHTKEQFEELLTHLGVKIPEDILDGVCR